MSKLISLLNKNPMTLIVSIPQARVEMAKAAEDAGADAVCIRLDTAKDKSDLIKIVDCVKIPVGATLEGESAVSETQMTGLYKLGFDFFDMSLAGIPSWALKLEGLGKIVALDQDYSAYDLTGLSQRSIDAIDAAVIPKEALGKDLLVGDLQHYITICLSTGLPVIVPTQKMIRVSEVPIIWDTGAKGIILTDIVAGNTLQSLKAVTKEFKEAIENLKE